MHPPRRTSNIQIFDFKLLLYQTAYFGKLLKFVAFAICYLYIKYECLFRNTIPYPCFQSLS